MCWGTCGMPPDWRQAAGLLDQWVEQQSISPEKQLTTAADGKAALEGLPTGLYLLCAAPYQKGGCTYTTTPVLLELPAQQAGGGWQYAATVEPKPGALRYPRTAGHHHTG